jgi:hypothetical protein
LAEFQYAPHTDMVMSTLDPWPKPKSVISSESHARTHEPRTKIGTMVQ